MPMVFLMHRGPGLVKELGAHLAKRGPMVRWSDGWMGSSQQVFMLVFTVISR